MSTTKHVKSVSWDEENEYHSAPSYRSPSESQRSDSLERTKRSQCIESSADPDPLRVYGLREDSDASDVSYIIDFKDHLLRVGDQWDAFGRGPSPCDANYSSDNTEAFPEYMEADNEISDHGSADWDSDQSLLDDMDDEVHQAHATSTGALFGDQPWKSITAMQMVADIMDAVNVHLPGFVLTDEGGKKYGDSLRDIFPEHERIVLMITSKTTKLSPEQVKHKLKRAIDLHQYICRRAPSEASLSTLKLYEPRNSNFDGLESAWTKWHRHIEKVQVDLISVLNMRAILIEGGQKLLAWKNEALHQHTQWRPEPRPVRSEHGDAHFVIGTTFDFETETHQLPKTLTAFGHAHELHLQAVVAEKNGNWVRLQRDVEKVMLALRYAQMQFRNVELNLEHALSLDIIMLQKAISAHEHLEIEWTYDVVGPSDESTLTTMGAQEEQGSPESDEIEDLIPSPVFHPTLDGMPSVNLVLSDIVDVEEFFNPGPTSICSGFNFDYERGADDGHRHSRSDDDSSVTSSEPRSIHSPPARELSHNNARKSMDTTATSVDDAPQNLKLDAATTPALEPSGLCIHSWHAQQGKQVESEKKKSAHEIFSEVMKKHESARVTGSPTEDEEQELLEDNDYLGSTAIVHKPLDELLAKHEAERVAREESYTSPAKEANRLHEFGLIDFENIRRIHGDIMSSLSSYTDERSHLGIAIRHLNQCQLCWCDAGNRPCVRCERLNLAYHFGPGEEGYWVGVEAEKQKRVVKGMEKKQACAYLGRRYCVASGDCELWCKSLTQKMKGDGCWIIGDVDVKGKGKEHQF